MKILIITETLYEGGAELFLLRLARGLMASGEEVQVISLNKQYENKEMTKLFTDVRVKRLSLPFLSVIEFIDKVLGKLNIDFSFKYSWQGKQLKRLVAGYDIVHTHYIQVDHLVATLKKKSSFKHIVTVHGDYSAQYDSFRKGELRFWLNLDKKLKTLASSVDQWIVVSEEQRLFFRDIMKVPADKIAKIYNGYLPPETSVTKIEKNEIFTIGMVARGTEQKGWQVLIDAFLKMPENTRLLLVGGSEYLGGLKMKYATNSRIVFTGFQPDPLQWMAQMDVFALPTLYPYESLPNVIAEALYCNLPVVATNVGEIERMITDDTTGKKAGYVINFDGKSLNEKDLYEKLKYLYDNPELINEMRETAKVAGLKFDMNKCITAYAAIYKKML